MLVFIINGNLSTTTDLGTQHPRKPSIPAKRSKPDSLTPPNGSDCAMYVEQKSLMDVIPASSCAPSFSARRVERVKMFEPRPKSQSLASAMDSSSLFVLTMASTGPKTSSRAMRMSCVMPEITVGG